MAENQPNREAWVEAAVRELRNAGSWTGRIHVHKLLSIIQLLKLATPPFRFELYHYGPYSRDLDATFAELEACGYLHRDYPKPGYGPQYDVGAQSSPSAKLSQNDETAIRKVAEVTGEWQSRRLELVATCLWVAKQEGEKEDDEIARRVNELKPQYTINSIKPFAKKAHELAARLDASRSDEQSFKASR